MQSVDREREASCGSVTGDSLDVRDHGGFRDFLRRVGFLHGEVSCRAADQPASHDSRIAALRRVPESIFEPADEGFRREQQAQATVVVQRRQRRQLQSPQRNADEIQQHDEPKHAKNSQISERHRHVNTEEKFRAKQHAIKTDRRRQRQILA